MQDGPAFAHIVSLGGDCEVAWQIRRVIEQPEAYPFDWLLLPTSAVIAHLAGGCAALVDEASLQTRAVGDLSTGRNKQIVFDVATGTEFHHDFPDPLEFTSHLPSVAAKYAALAARLFALSEAALPVLFVRKGQPAADDRRLLDSLDASLPGTQAHLLVIDPAPGAASLDSDRIMRRPLDITGRVHWQESTPQWRNLLMEAARPGFAAGRLRLV